MSDSFMWQDNLDEGDYCENCDTSTYEGLNIVPVGQWRQRYSCPNCGYVHPEVFPSDYFYAFGSYLLGCVDNEYEDWVETPPFSRLPSYD